MADTTRQHNCRAQVDLAFVDETIRRTGSAPDAVIPILQALQEKFHYLPQAALDRVCSTTRITPAAIAGVSTFYTQFRHSPAGEHIVRVCHGTACHVKGSELVDDALRRALKLQDGQDTDAAGKFTLERVGCLGCCTLAPVVQVGAATFGAVTPDGAAAVLEEAARKASANGSSQDLCATRNGDPAEAEIRIGVGSCCVAGGSLGVRAQLEESVAAAGAGAAVKPVGCVGMCHQTPMVEVTWKDRPSALYTKVTPEDAAAIIRRHFRPRGLWRRLRATIAHNLDRLVAEEPPRHPTHRATRDGEICEFLGPQQRLATENCGHLNPLDLDEYLRHDGFAALRRCLELKTPDQIIADVTASGLRGRGGAGFLTGRKWALTRASAGTDKYIICNGDEGDPGAFMDRMILESYPYRVLEGMTIAALAVGAEHGVLYIRAEYPLAVERIRHAIDICESRNLLGENILGSGRSLRLAIREGAGAFVCGEETALIASIEGRRGMPQLRPPFPAQEGLWNKPTNINNVETYALVPWILRHGPDQFAAIGTARSKGTKVFALTGKVVRGGLIEVPMGISIRRIVEEIGGGIANGRTFKAVQIGGPSGGCIPAALADTPVDYESLAAAGAMMGSGGLVVMDDSDCVVDIARYFLNFTQTESCGKCTFCRVGTRRMLDILDRICAGKGRPADLAALEQLSATVKQGSLCGLGQTAPNPVLTTLRYFREEYEEHLKGRCRAGKCKALIRYAVGDGCIGCTKCAQECPAAAIPFTPYAKHTIDAARCTRCDICRRICPTNAISIA